MDTKETVNRQVMERCEECGFVWDLAPCSETPARIAESTAVLRELVLPPDRPRGWAERAATRMAPETWSALEYICHLRDVLFVQRDRVFQIIVEDCPAFGPMHREERVTLAGYADEDLADVVAQTEMAGNLLARTLGRLDRQQFARTGVYTYPTTAARTLEWVTAQALHEILHHTGDIAKQLAPHVPSIDDVRVSPADNGTLELIVRRPAVDSRETLEVGELDTATGLIGDSWDQRPSSRMPDRSPHPEMQLNLMNARAAALIAGDRERWPLAGDQLFVDLDLSSATLTPGTQLAIGTGVIEITALPHRGCGKFAARFGRDALRLVNSAAGRELNLRGVNAKVVRNGTIRTGDTVRRLV